MHSLLEKLNDEEVIALLTNVGITFWGGNDHLDRNIAEGALEEADREDFYREYRKLKT